MTWSASQGRNHHVGAGPEAWSPGRRDAGEHDVQQPVDVVLVDGFAEGEDAPKHGSRDQIDDEAIAAAAAGLRIGDPSDPATVVGPVITEAQRLRIDDLVRRAGVRRFSSLSELLATVWLQ